MYTQKTRRMSPKRGHTTPPIERRAPWIGNDAALPKKEITNSGLICDAAAKIE
jgi:hypothetical protein